MQRLRLVLDVDGVVIRGRPDDGLPWYQTLREDLGLDRDVLTDRFFNAGFLDSLRGRADIRELLESTRVASAAGVAIARFRSVRVAKPILGRGLFVTSFLARV